MIHPYRQFIQSYVSLSANDWLAIESRLVKMHLPKGELLLKEGRLCKNVWFLESGLLRFFIWKDGVDVSKFFTKAPYCLTSQRSYTFELPAEENIEALEDSILWQMSRASAYSLLSNPRWSEFVRKLTQEVQYFTEQIYEEIQNETAEDRYRKLLQQGSPLVSKVPLRHLASYLGIAPQSMSRIRKKILSDIKT